MNRTMNRTEIEKMPAGREMDALIAIHLFGWYEEHFDGVQRMVLPPAGHPASEGAWAAHWDENGCPDWMPHYSTDIAGAWEVVEKIKSLKSYEVCIWSDWTMAYKCNFGNAFTPRVNQEATADTAPLAICRAALIAMVEDAD